MGVQGPMLLLLLLVCVVLGKSGELRRFIHQTGGNGGVWETRRPSEAHLLTSTQDRVKKARRWQVRNYGPCEKHPLSPGLKRSPHLFHSPPTGLKTTDIKLLSSD